MWIVLVAALPCPCLHAVAADRFDIQPFDDHIQPFDTHVRVRADVAPRSIDPRDYRYEVDRSSSDLLPSLNPQRVWQERAQDAFIESLDAQTALVSDLVPGGSVVYDGAKTLVDVMSGQWDDAGWDSMWLGFHAEMDFLEHDPLTPRLMRHVVIPFVWGFEVGHDAVRVIDKGIEFQRVVREPLNVLVPGERIESTDLHSRTVRITSDIVATIKAGPGTGIIGYDIAKDSYTIEKVRLNPEVTTTVTGAQDLSILKRVDPVSYESFKPFFEKTTPVGFERVGTIIADGLETGVRAGLSTDRIERVRIEPPVKIERIEPLASQRVVLDGVFSGVRAGLDRQMFEPLERQRFEPMRFEPPMSFEPVPFQSPVIDGFIAGLNGGFDRQVWRPEPPTRFEPPMRFEPPATFEPPARFEPPMRFEPPPRFDTYRDR